MAKRNQRSKRQTPQKTNSPSAPVVADTAAAAAQPTRSQELRESWATFAILAIAVLVVYLPSINAPFIFDDVPSIKENPSVVRLWPLIGDNQRGGPLNPPKNFPTAGRPLANLTLALNYFFGELNPRGYHLFNIVLHLLSATLLAAIVRRTLRLDYFAGRFEKAAWPLSIFVGLLWAVHPLLTEAVIYVTQRTELLVGFFYLATLYASIRYWSTNISNSRTMWLVLAIASSLCGMASKEVMATAPLVVLLYDRAFINGSFATALRRSRHLYAGLACGWLLLLWLNYDAPRGGSAGFNHGMAGHIWWFTQAKVLWIYLKLVIWPWPLLIHYEMPYLDVLRVAWPWLALTGALAAITLVLLWRNRPVGFLLASLWLILAPTIIVPILTEVAAERRMYLPLAALITLVIAGSYSLLPRVPAWLTSAAAALSVVLAVTLAAASMIHLRDYDDEITLWRTAVTSQPDQPVIRADFAAVLINRGDGPDALEQAQMAVKLGPLNGRAHNRLGEALVLSGREAEATEHFKRAAELDPSDSEPFNNLGALLRTSHKLPEAIETLRKAIKVRPNDFKAQTNLGSALMENGQTAEAIAVLKKTLELRPDFPSAHTALGFALLNSGQTARAIEQFQEAARLNPSVATLDNLGTVLMRQGQLPEALTQFLAATQAGPNDIPAWTDLATAYARLGQFPEAVSAAEKALALARSAGEANTVKKLEARLAAYRAGKAEPDASRNTLAPAGENH